MTPDEAIENHSRLVFKFVSRFHRYFNASSAFDRDDLIQIGYIQLLKAVYKFDPNRDIKFSTYAARWIIGGIRTFLRDNLAGMRVSRDLRLFERVGRVGSLNIEKDDSGNEMIDLLKCPNSYNGSELTILIDSVLNERERIVFKLNFEGYTQREIAPRIGVKQVQAGRILKRSQIRIAAALRGGECS